MVVENLLFFKMYLPYIENLVKAKILFNGKNIDELSFRQTALDLAVVAQHNFYNFDFKVLDVVLMGRSPHKKFLEKR